MTHERDAYRRSHRRDAAVGHARDSKHERRIGERAVGRAHELCAAPDRDHLEGADRAHEAANGRRLEGSPPEEEDQLVEDGERQVEGQVRSAGGLDELLPVE